MCRSRPPAPKRGLAAGDEQTAAEVAGVGDEGLLGTVAHGVGGDVLEDDEVVVLEREVVGEGGWRDEIDVEAALAEGVGERCAAAGGAGVADAVGDKDSASARSDGEGFAGVIVGEGVVR